MYETMGLFGHLTAFWTLRVLLDTDYRNSTTDPNERAIFELWHDDPARDSMETRDLRIDS